ncbi:MAG: hypothetical protein KME27_17415 [Lyngbya sp. HA4199-MV5]|jgi:hypothetical protein|nr:hypothetical protein [Lyngbya sp. HA4199-MV5]
MQILEVGALNRQESIEVRQKLQGALKNTLQVQLKPCYYSSHQVELTVDAKNP